MNVFNECDPPTKRPHPTPTQVCASQKIQTN